MAQQIHNPAVKTYYILYDTPQRNNPKVWGCVDAGLYMDSGYDFIWTSTSQDTWKDRLQEQIGPNVEIYGCSGDDIGIGNE